MVDTLDSLRLTSAIETAPLLPNPKYVSLSVEDMEHIKPSVSGGDRTQKLHQKEDFWIRRLEALNYPGLSEDVDYTYFLNGFPYLYSLWGVFCYLCECLLCMLYACNVFSFINFTASLTCICYTCYCVSLSGSCLFRALMQTSWSKVFLT